MDARVGVPQVDGEVVQQPLHVRPLPIPLRQAMDREGVPQVVQPRLVASTVRSAYPRMFPEPLECVVHRLHVNRGPTSAEEEAARRAVPWMRCRSPAGVVGQHACQIVDRWDQAGLEELGIADGEQGVRQIDVRDGQGQRLTDAQPGPVQQQQDRPQGVRFDQGAVVLGRRDRIQQPADFVSRCRCTGRRRRGAWAGPSAAGPRSDGRG